MLGILYPLLVTKAASPIESLLAQGDETHSLAGARRALRGGGVETLGDLAVMTWADLRDIAHVGSGALSEIEVLCVAGQHATLAPPAASDEEEKGVVGDGDSTAGPPDPLLGVADDIRLLADWCATVTGAVTWRDGAGAMNGRPIPPDIVEVLERIGDHPTGASPDRPEEIIHGWAISLEERERDILHSRIVERTTTLDDLGTRHDVTRERIRQVEVKLRRSLESLCHHDDEARPIRWAVFDLQQRVGACAPVSALHDLDIESMEGRLLIHLAGLTTGEFPGTVNMVRFTLPSVESLVLPPEDVVVDVDQLVSALTKQGVLQQHIDHVLTLLPVKRIEGTYVVWPKSIVKRSIAHLAVRLTPMESEELFATSGGSSHRGWRDRMLSHLDVHRVSRNQFALRSWGLAEYTSVVDHMLEVIDASSGSMWLRDLTEGLLRDYDIKPGSTLAYSVAPPDEPVVHDGLIWRRSDSEPYVVPNDIRYARGIFRTGSQTASWVVPVDSELARGSGRPSPVELAHLLRFEPGESVTFDGDRYVVRLTWNERSHMGPTCSSLRPVMQALEATVGESIRLDFDRLANSVSAKRMGVDDEVATIERLRELTGLALPRSIDARTAVAAAIGTQPERVADLLRERSDDKVARLLDSLPTSASADAQDRPVSDIEESSA